MISDIRFHAMKTFLSVLTAGFFLVGCAFAPGESDEASLIKHAETASQTGDRSMLCLTTHGSADPALEIAVRRALADRGWDVRWYEDPREATSRTCRFMVSLSSGQARNPSELPDFIAVEYRDAYTGESDRAYWKKRSGYGLMRAAAETLPLGDNALLTGYYDDPERIVRGLVERLIPFAPHL